jgi:hypothetical protein
MKAQNLKAQKSQRIISAKVTHNMISPEQREYFHQTLGINQEYTSGSYLFQPLYISLNCIICINPICDLKTLDI